MTDSFKPWTPVTAPPPCDIDDPTPHHHHPSTKAWPLHHWQPIDLCPNPSLPSRLFAMTGRGSDCWHHPPTHPQLHPHSTHPQEYNDSVSRHPSLLTSSKQLKLLLLSCFGSTCEGESRFCAFVFCFYFLLMWAMLTQLSSVHFFTSSRGTWNNRRKQHLHL